MAQSALSSPTWSTQTAFVLAAVGSAVGLGNLWKFPYITGEHGGGAFVLVYLACILLIGLPVLMAEIAMGRKGRGSPPETMAKLAKENRSSKLWWLLGVNGMLAGVLILSFYTVIAGWGIAYFVDSLTGQFVGIGATEAGNHFKALIADPYQLLLWHTLVMLFTIVVVSRGVKSGIEKAISLMMPALFVLLIILFGYALSTSGFTQSVNFLFKADFSKLTGESVLVAMGHAFFTLSIGMGAMMVYGAYLSKKHSVIKAGIWISFADMAVALIAGVIIFSIVFSNNLTPGSGPGLLFETLPVAFGDMFGGWFFGTLFFGLVVLAALSSAISLIEPTIRWCESRWKMARKKAAWLVGSLTWLLGITTILSFNLWSDVSIIGDKNFFESLDLLTANIMLPLGGLLMAVFFGWIMTKESIKQELNLTDSWMPVFLLVLKFVTPIAVAIVFVANFL